MEEVPQKGKNKKGLLIGGGCIVIAAAIAVICLFGGKKGEDICNDESPVGFFEKKNQPKFTLSNPDAAPYEVGNEFLFTNPKDGVKNMREKENTFCSLYADELNKNLSDDQKITVEQVINGSWQYANAYASYYQMKKVASLSSKVKFPQIFDGGINCAVNGSQIYVHETNAKYDFSPTINIRKNLKSVEYFGIYAASAYGTLHVDFTLSLLKKESGSVYHQYGFTFPATIHKGNGIIPTFYGAYFEDFGIDKEELAGCSMISFSYAITSWDYTPSSQEETPEEAFLKLYEILLPESEWE